MKTFKRILIFLVCFSVLLSSFIFSYSAVEYDFYTGREMIYDNNEGFYYLPYRPLENDPIMPLIASEPYYSNFDVNKLPWLDMPLYVQEILYSEPQGNVNDVTYAGVYKLPFVFVAVAATTVHVVAGWNLSIGSYFRTADEVSSYDPTAVFICAPKFSSQVFQHSICYHAYYDATDYSLKTPWSVAEAVDVGDKMVRYIQVTWPESGKRDYYCYGFNGIKPGVTHMYIPIYSDGSSYPRYQVYNNPVSGFASGAFVYYPAEWTNYFGAFTPPTAEQQQSSTQKGIWESIKALPGQIASSIKGFFTSLGDRIGDFFTSLKNYLLYFQESKPEHINPFENLLSRFEDFMNDNISKFSSFSNNTESIKERVLVYVSDLSYLVDRVTSFNIIFISFLLLVLFICISRKVIGR